MTQRLRRPTDARSHRLFPARTTLNSKRRICPHGNGPTSSPPRFAHSCTRKDVAMDERERHNAGMKMRRKVLGDAHVDRAESAKTAMDADFQNLITRYAWGEI